MPDALLCAGGPFDGRHVTATGDSFVAADTVANRCWLYRRAGDQWRVCLDHDNTLIYPDGPRTGERRLDWSRLPIGAAGLEVVPVVDAEENHAGGPVDDGFADLPPGDPEGAR